MSGSRAMSDFTVGVIGLGYFAQFHLKAWADLPGVHLIGVTDLNPEVVTQAAATYATTGHTDAASLLAANPDILDIVAPPPAHAALIRQALRKGRTIICQKPFCTSLAEAEAVTAEAEATGTTIVIHENFRFQPWHREIKRLLDDGALGQIYQARFALRPGDGRGPDAYLARQPAFQTMPRLLIHETGVHFIDLFRRLLGEPTSVYADIRHLNPVLAGEDEGLLIMDHATGARSVFDGNRLADHVADNARRTMGEMEIEGEAGRLRLDGAGRLWMREFGEQVEREIPVTMPVDDDSFGGGCVANLIVHVVDAVRQGRAPENTARDYLQVIRLTDAAYTSAAEGRRVLV
jgi:predicted dehydrogenase